MNFEDLTKQRYSCRKFSDKKVNQDLVDKIIEIANTAPTAVNKQPFKIFNIKSEEVKEALKQVCRYTFGAETFLMVGYKDEESWTRKFDNRPFADVDASIVGTYIMLAVDELGLRTTWVGYFDAPKFKELCPQLKDYELIAIFPIGYECEESEPGPLHFKRKAIEEIVENI